MNISDDQIEDLARALAGDVWGWLSAIERDRLRLQAKKMLGTTNAPKDETQVR